MSAAPTLPAGLTLLERGWLSSNSLLGIDAGRAALIDSGYVSHAAQTVDLVRHALGGARLERLYNTHSHSDHIGGNAAVAAAFGCEVVVPAGIDAKIAEWDEEALLLSPLGQDAARFGHDRVLAAGDRFELGGLEWTAIAVPGHDMDALAFHNVEKRLLVSGDALWRDGFGVIFSELLGHPEDGGGLRATRETLDRLARLGVDIVIPGHGPAFAAVDDAFERAYRRLAAFEADVERLARHALKVILVFALLDRRRIARAELPAFLAGMSFARSVNARYLGLDEAALAAWLATDLVGAGVLREEDGILFAV